MALAMIDSWKLVTIGMWVDKVEKAGALSLICDNFEWDELWEAAAELNQQCTLRKLEVHIPRNRDQGDLKDRVRVLGTAVLSSLQELKSHSDPPVFVVTSASLAMVPGVIKSNVKADPAVATRLDNMERMLETLSKGMQEMKSNQLTQWPALQVNGVPLQQPGQQAQGVGRPAVGAETRTGARTKQQSLPVGGQHLRSRSDSRKRKAEEDLQVHGQPEQQAGGVQDNSQQDEKYGWNDVARGRRKKVQYGTSKLRVSGGDAAPYDVFVGNTHPESTEEIIREVLVKVSEVMPEDQKLSEPLEILEIECLTKPRDDGRKLWSKNWRVQVSNRFREHMLRPEAYPIGWSSRRYFPARAPRQPVPALDPTNQQPAQKRPHLVQGPPGQPVVAN